MVPPLSGITVVELCTSVAGPYAGLVLGQLGARVVKVERPGGGDETRAWKPPAVNGASVMFSVMNAGKESVVLDLKSESGRRRLDELLAAADVLLTNLRQASLDRLGLGEAQLSAAHPRLVLCRISAFGPDGPYAADPGYDPLVQALSGLMSITGEPDGIPVRVGTSIIDMGTGMWAALGVLAALRQRDADGVAVPVDTSLLETGIAWLPYQIAGYLATGEEPVRHGSGLPMLAPYQAFGTADGHMVIGIGNDRMWLRLCAALQREDLAEDERLATNERRIAERPRLVAELGRTLVEHGREHWLERLRAHGVPAAPVLGVAAAVEHEQVRALQILTEVEGGACFPGLPLSLGGWRPRPQGGPPAYAADD